MNVKRPIYWHHGLFLQPQHFQLLEENYGSRLNALRERIPYSWGVYSMEVDRGALNNQVFSLLKGEFLFPDGSYVSFPENAVLAARSFEKGWLENEKGFLVYLGLRKFDVTRSNVTVLRDLGEISEVTTRFVTTEAPEEVVDFYADGPRGQVRQLRYVLRLFWETERENLGDYVYFPLARVERQGDEIVLSEQFIPPALSLTASEALLKLVREIRDLMVAKARQLEEFKVQRGIHSTDFSSRDLLYLLALRCFSRYAPLLMHFTETGNVHPWEVYGVLRQLVGELSTFSETYDLFGAPKGEEKGLPPYDHWDAYSGFREIRNVLSELIDEITAGPEYVIALPYDGTYFSTELAASVFSAGYSYYLVVRTSEDEETIIKDFLTSAKISSREYLPLLIARALPGLRVEYLSSPPPQLPKRAGCTYWRLDTAGDHWGAIQKGQNIAIYWDSAPQDVEISLMVVTA